MSDIEKSITGIQEWAERVARAIPDADHREAVLNHLTRFNDNVPYRAPEAWKSDANKLIMSVSSILSGASKKREPWACSPAMVALFCEHRAIVIQ